MSLRIIAAVALLGVGGCADDAADQSGAPLSAVCRPTGTHDLPEAVRESSGLALSRGRPNILWTHNDRGNQPDLFAVDTRGRLLQTVRVAVSAIDWEDVDIGPCNGGTCLYIADIGDNEAKRDDITIHRLPEPAAGVQQVTAVDSFRVRFPDGARDAEALFTLPSGDLFIVSKGRGSDIALYRYRAPQDPSRITLLERVRALFPPPSSARDRVSAAAATPDGRRVGIRSYRRLYLYDAAQLVGGEPLKPTVIDLEPLGERQGEGLALADDGTVWLSSEAENRRGLARLSGLACSPSTSHIAAAFKRADADTLIVADGTSRRHQILDGASRDARHVASRAWRSLALGPKAPVRSRARATTAPRRPRQRGS